MKTRIIVAATAALLLSFGSIGIASAAFADDTTPTDPATTPVSETTPATPATPATPEPAAPDTTEQSVTIQSAPETPTPTYTLTAWQLGAGSTSGSPWVTAQTKIAEITVSDETLAQFDSSASLTCGNIYQIDLYTVPVVGNTLTGPSTPNVEMFPSDKNPHWKYITKDACPKPTVQPCTALGNVKTTGNAEGGLPSPWDTSNTRATGHNVIVGTGLHVYTEGATSTDKAAAYYPVSIPLSNIGTPTINYSSSIGTPPGFQIVLSDGRILVGEPSYYGDRFWSKTAEAGVPAADGYPASADLNTWLAAMPTAQVAYIGYSLGSGVKGDSTITSLSMGAGCNLTFAAYVAPVVTTPPVAPPLTPVLAETGVNDTVPLIIALSIAVTGMLMLIAGVAYTKRREAIELNKE